MLALDIPPHGLLRGLNSILPADVGDRRRRRGRARLRRPLLGARQGLPLHGLEPLRALAAARRARAWHVRRAARHATPSGAPPRSLVGEHDFRAFRASDCDRRTTSRIVRRLDVDRQGALLTFDIEATAFLKNMVRIVVGTLVDIGRGRIPEDAPARMLATGDRSAGGMTAPAARPDATSRDLLKADGEPLSRRSPSIVGDAARGTLAISALAIARTGQAGGRDRLADSRR